MYAVLCEHTWLGRCEGRPCRALSFWLQFTQGLVALTGLRTLGFDGIAPLGLAWPLLADRCGVSVDYLCRGRGISRIVAAPFLSASLGLRVRSSQL